MRTHGLVYMVRKRTKRELALCIRRSVVLNVVQNLGYFLEGLLLKLELALPVSLLDDILACCLD